MQKIRKLRLSIKAISPIISVLLLIAIAVVASLVVYAWVMGYIGGSTTKAGYAINIQSFSSTQNGNLTIYVQNTGQGAVQLNPASAVYINSSLVQPILSPAAGANGLITIPQGQTTALIVYYPYSGPITVKIVTTSGTFMTTSGTSNGSGTTYSVSFNTSGGGGSSTTSPSGTGPYAGPITISANAGAGYSFSAWSATGSITFTDAASSSTTATVNGAGTVTATFTKTNYQVTFVTSPTGAGTTSPSTAGSYTMGQQVSISAVAGSNYKFSSWSATGVTIADASSASTTATVNGAGTVTANFIALHILTSITISPASSSIAAGGSQSYTAAGFDQNGVSMGDVTSSSTFSVNGASISGSSVTEASAGSYSVTASDGGVTSNTATLTVFGVLTSFSFGPINSPQAAGSPFTVTIAAQDAGSHTITNFAGSAALTDLSGTLSVNTGPFTNGVWTGPVTITKPLINDVITATASSVVGQSGMFNINSGAATSFAVTGFTNPVAAGTAGSVTVTAMDAYGNTATGYTGTVAITSSDIQAVLPPSATLTNGVRFFVVTLKTAGTQSIIATDTVTSTITGSQTGIIVNAGGSAASFVVSGFTNPVAAGTAGSVTVTAVDAYGNVVTGYAGTVAITSSDAKAVLPASAGLINGLGSFAVTLKTAGSQSITATDTVTNSMTGSQTGITVTAGSLASFTFGTISSPTAGTPFMITITAYDASGNVATNYAGTAMLTDVTGSLSPTSATFIAGVYSGPVTISKTMVNDAITVTDSASGVTATSTAFTVSPGPLASFTISTISNPQTAGTPGFSITITAYDSLGNVETNYVGPAGLSDLSGSLSPTSVAFTAGVYTSKVTIGTANTADVITVKDSSTSITASSNSFNVVAGTVAHFVFNTIGQQTAGTAFTVTITAKDTGGNTVLGYTGSASFTDLSGSISLKSTGVFTNGVLQASVAISKAYANDVITATDTTTGATGTSNTFTVVAAPATQLVFTAGVGQSLTASTVSLVITVQLQDSNGNPVAAGTGGVSVSLTSTDTTTGTFWSDAAGTIKITAPITILAGQSSYSFYYSDTASGSPTLTASSTGLTSATTTFTISTDKLVFVQGATQTLAPGQTSTGIVIEQETPTGSPDYIILGTTQITVTTSSPTGEFSTTPGGTLTHSITVDVTGLFAYESSTFYYVDSAAGTPELTAVAGGFTPGTTMFTIYTATLSSFKITSTSSPVAVGASFSITITALDQQSNTMTGYTGTNTLSASAGSISPLTTGAFVNGVWTGSVSLNTAGSITISTSGGGATGTSSAINVYTPTLTSFSFGTISGTKTAGTTFSVTITAKDQNGNTMTSYNGLTTLTETGGGAGGTVSSPSVTFSNGVYTGNVYVTKAGSGVTITATSGTTSTTSVSTFTVNMGAVVSVTVSPVTDSVTAGSQVTYTATGTDAYGNTGSITNSVTWSITTGTGGSWDNNVYTSHTAGTWTVTANAGGGVTGTATLTVTAGALTQFVFSHINTQTSGIAFSVTITAEDQYGNTVTNYAGTQTLHCSSGSATLTPTTVTFTNGVATPSVTITVSSSRNLDLYITYNGNQYTSNTFTV